MLPCVLGRERNFTQRRKGAKEIKPKLFNMDENYLAKVIVNTCYNIHLDLGPGLLESVYEEILYYELTSQGLRG